MLDLADMNALEIDPSQRTAWAQTGLTAGAYTTAANAYGLATALATPARSASAGSPWAAASGCWSGSTA
jgi:FAD/FMN-containing dehydrogenase